VASCTLAILLRKKAGSAVAPGRHHVCRDGACWRTISDAPVNGGANTCENKRWYPLPAGCAIAPDDGLSHKIAKAYGWSTHVVVFSNGGAWGTKNYGSNRFVGNRLLRNGNSYKVASCTLAILLKCSGGSSKKAGVLSCATNSAASNNAGVVATNAHGGYTMTGGGLNNRYRHWNARSAFEESYPYGNQWRCDTGFGPGQVTCYARSCKTNVGALACTTRSSRRNGSGTVHVTAPGGYQMTGCGLYNHYRHWNAHALFERIHPHGNGCLGDMGAGYGQFTVYTRACKAPAGYTLSCKNVNTGRSNYHAANCPGGYTMTGCGIQNFYGGWNAKSGIENLAQPHGNGCLCDTGFGTGDNMCFARCCKLV